MLIVSYKLSRDHGVERRTGRMNTLEKLNFDVEMRQVHLPRDTSGECN